MNTFRRNRNIRKTLLFQLGCIVLFGIGYLILFLIKKGIVESPFLSLIGMGLLVTSLIVFSASILFLIYFALNKSNRLNKGERLNFIKKVLITSLLFYGIGRLILYLNQQNIIDSPIIYLIGYGMVVTTLIIFPISLILLFVFIVERN